MCSSAVPNEFHTGSEALQPKPTAENMALRQEQQIFALKNLLTCDPEEELKLAVQGLLEGKVFYLTLEEFTTVS